MFLHPSPPNCPPCSFIVHVKKLSSNCSFFQGEKIFVFDDLFPVDLLDHMRAHVLKYGTYFYDDSIDDESDNVQWIAGFDMPLYTKSPYWKIIHAVRYYIFYSSIEATTVVWYQVDSPNLRYLCHFIMGWAKRLSRLGKRKLGESVAGQTVLKSVVSWCNPAD